MSLLKLKLFRISGKKIQKTNKEIKKGRTREKKVPAHIIYVTSSLLHEI